MSRFLKGFGLQAEKFGVTVKTKSFVSFFKNEGLSLNDKNVMSQQNIHYTHRADAL